MCTIMVLQTLVALSRYQEAQGSSKFREQEQDLKFHRIRLRSSGNNYCSHLDLLFEVLERVTQKLRIVSVVEAMA